MSESSADTLEVVLVKAGRTKIRYPARLLSDDGTRITVRAPWAAPGARDFGFVRFEPGDVFTEHYWRNRWYAVKEVYAADGTLKGWYCDVTRPAARDGDALMVEDLDLDLVVLGGRRDGPAPGRGRVRGKRPAHHGPGRGGRGPARPRGAGVAGARRPSADPLTTRPRQVRATARSERWGGEV